RPPERRWPCSWPGKRLVANRAVPPVANDDGHTLARIGQPRFVVPGCADRVMSLTASPPAPVSPAERLEVLFEELAELAGQRNAIDGRIVEIVAELDRDELCGATGGRAVAGLGAWMMGWLLGNVYELTPRERR